MKFTKPEEVLNGKDMNDDLMKALRYMWSVGSTEVASPREHCLELVGCFLRKHRPDGVVVDPRRLKSVVTELKRSRNELKQLQKTEENFKNLSFVLKNQRESGNAGYDCDDSLYWLSEAIEKYDHPLKQLDNPDVSEDSRGESTSKVSAKN